MAKIDVVKVEGFEELNRKLKQLNDKVKRSEIIKIQRRLAKPIERAYSEELPEGDRDKKRFGTTYSKGTLRKSVSTRAVPKSKTGGNPSIVIRPGKKGKADAFYRFMVVKKGTKVGSTKRGSRKGRNDVVEKARDRALQKVGPKSEKEAAEKTANYIQKQINRLSS